MTLSLQLIDGLDASDLRLNISTTLANSLFRVITLPYGAPAALLAHRVVPVVNHGFISGYSLRVKLPVWTVVSLQSTVRVRTVKREREISINRFLKL